MDPRSAGPMHGVLHPGFARRPDVLIVTKDTAGLLETDDCSLRVTARTGADVVVSDPGPTKLLSAMSDAVGRQQVHIGVEADARVIYVPHAVVPITGSRAELSTTIDVAAGGQFACAGVLAAGRPSLGEVWAQSHLRQTLRIHLDGYPIYHETIGLAGAPGSDPRHQTSLIIHDQRGVDVSALREAIPSAAVVEPVAGLVSLRAFVARAEDAYSIIRRAVAIWAPSLPEATWGRCGFAA